MSSNRWRVAGIAEPQATWFSEMARWSTQAAIPVDFVKCLSADEFRTRLIVGETFSAILVGSGAVGVDLSLTAEARDHDCTLIGIGDPAASRWSDLGIAVVLPEDFRRDDLIAALTDHAVVPVHQSDIAELEHTFDPVGWLGRLVCVTGAGGTGASLLAMCLSAELASGASNRAMVLLADLALHAEQAMLHDTRDVIPGVRDLLEAFAEGRSGRDLVRSVVFEPEGRGYHLLLGLRRHRDWVAVQRRSLVAVTELLLRTYRYVVADVDADTEGISETGSADVERRNLMSRTALDRADLVVVVGTGDTKGLGSLVRTVQTLVESGLEAQRLLAVINRVSRRPVHRAGAASALASLLADTPAARLGAPVLVRERRFVEPALRDGLAPPGSLVRPLIAEVRSRLQTLAPRHGPSHPAQNGPSNLNGPSGPSNLNGPSGPSGPNGLHDMQGQQSQQGQEGDTS